MINLTNEEQQEVAKFSALANIWWDKEGELKTLHDINPARMAFIAEQVSLKGKQVLDVGCGGGILTESLAQTGAVVTGVDASDAAIAAAKKHSQQMKLDIHYQCSTIDEFASNNLSQFDVITCLELLEHVDDPAAIIQSCSQMLKIGGSLFLSTLNRTWQAYLFAILGAEYILQLLPKQTHDYSKFIRPSELNTWLRQCNLQSKKITGISYNPFSRIATLSENIEVNYLIYAKKID